MKKVLLMKSIITASIAVLAFLSGSVQALDTAALSAALSNSASRADADKARDAGRKPAYVVDVYQGEAEPNIPKSSETN